MHRDIRRMSYLLAVTFILASLVALAAGCGAANPAPGPGANSPPETHTFEPGVTIDLDALVGVPPVTLRSFMRSPGAALALIGSPPGGYTWKFQDGWGHSLADSAGLSLVGALLTTPDCRLPNPPGWPYAIPVEAWRDGAKFFSITITADERFISSSVVCYIVSGETLCRDPSAGVTVEAGKTVQFYSLVRATCTTSYSPPLPAGACPATDPAYAFCR